MAAQLPDIDTKNVTVGKPVKGGCVYINFGDNPTFPTDATTKMSTLEGWESTGEVSEEGYTEGKSVTKNAFKGWHGSVVLTSISDEENTYKLELIEPTRPTVAKLRYGVDAVKTGPDGQITEIVPTVCADIKVSIVIDEVQSNGLLRRTLVRRAVIESFDDVAHKPTELLKYGMTFTALDPGDGHPINLFFAKPVVA